ncbi:bifunctional proline dehydrogenase/L-glutamate gamma-semialdehyde dehydrogenase PutA [Nevskia ramosa]|uniref:bifunctional proline dehydrogenase/L-glutamate gamma-semialdehyde dehydrogenase PutA n=1 Tax=Nevskia ramosa TaxID=64002 RepID=UPI003D104533
MNAPETLPAFIFDTPPPARSPLRAAIAELYLADETAIVNRLLAIAELPAERAAQVVVTAADWVRRVRKLKATQSALDCFMREYDLSSDEGVLLMCLAEALLRIPDDETAEKLIADKLADADWETHLGHSESLFVNASTWGLMLTGRIVRAPADTAGSFKAAWSRLVNRSTEPVVRLAIRSAMRMMGSQFVMGRSIHEALEAAQTKEQRPYRHSYDMLGEAALTAADADRYLASYLDAITAIGHAARGIHGGVEARPGISVKLSALHPRYEHAKRSRVLAELTPRLLLLAQSARASGISLCIDAEEADRLSLSLDLFECVYRDASLSHWDGLGLAVQGFQKRAIAVIEWLEALGREVGRRIPVRLVKGAYWDTEVKRAQEAGLAGYPVFTRKANTDVAYLACARRLLAARDVFYPQLATHNAHTVAAMKAYACESAIGGMTGFEFQRLHGMGEALYDVVREDCAVPCRVYSPVGSHADLLPYLVRRLLENGANTSFVNRIFDENIAAEQLVADPVAMVRALAVKPNPGLPLPAELYGAARRNSAGLNLADETCACALARDLQSAEALTRVASLCYDGSATTGTPQTLRKPADRRVALGEWLAFDPAAAGDVVAAAVGSAERWNAIPVESRAAILDRAADRLEAARPLFLRLLIEEAGKTLSDAQAEVREAADFLRYYAAAARRLLAHPETLAGPTGEHNELQLHGRGVFVCISPWNFPLAIFTGQIAAALVAGNPVIAKPAEQTPMIATAMAQLLREAGVPSYVFQCVLGDGAVGAALIAAAGVAGVAFTGSSEVARLINRQLAMRDGPIATLVAETGGQNVMIADSSSLPEQVVKDALASAFGSAGQRCSALRVLYLQDDIADKTLSMLKGAMRELTIGDPALLATDIGPVIDEAARARLEAHAAAISQSGKLIERLSLPEHCAHGSFVAPLAVEISGIEALSEEHFGPILHVARFSSRRLDAVVDAINASGYGLTLGIHSRIESTWRRVQSRAKVGNVYINRSMTGAVVGVQPFGGEGLSGTGPKAGGPHYLLRFVTERTLTINTAAVGGNARLLSQSG